MKELLDFAVEHKGAATVAGAWLLRELHVAYHFARASWPEICQAYLYFRDNEGLRGVVRNFFVGKPKTETTTNKPE